MTLIGCVVTFLTLFGGMMAKFVDAFGRGLGSYKLSSSGALPAVVCWCCVPYDTVRT
jgi:hypothetical protein